MAKPLEPCWDPACDGLQREPPQNPARRHGAMAGALVLQSVSWSGDYPSDDPGVEYPATDVLQKSHWEKLGIKSLRRGSVRSHQDFSRKTLIALVTSGLLLAFLGLAGYFLMRRRSWSPAAERLGEDPYYLESDSQGNTMLTTASHEPAEPPEKANANGGAQENGTGQGASAKPSSTPWPTPR
ncbi:PREDICTED: hematopoietic progenitor cell antigen CD34, partial [Tinamus guttatus]|uniref:hematopoietic progenitor cell antigen CD34 n=1 Tax=Tinamus guttatus TaxID=94827 RepID=UPI00052EA4C3